MTISVKKNLAVKQIANHLQYFPLASTVVQTRYTTVYQF